MVHIFNRRELLTTFSLDEQARVRGILGTSQIDYTVKTVNRTSPSPFSAGSRGRSGNFEINPDAMYEYIIYVKSADYEKALYLIRK